VKRLIIQYRGRELKNIPLGPGVTTLGGPGADVVLDVSGDFVSPEHCHFSVEEELVEIIDGWPGGRTRSAYGVHVNGIRIDRFDIEEGDVIALGDPADPKRHVELLVLEEGRDALNVNLTARWKQAALDESEETGYQDTKTKPMPAVGGEAPESIPEVPQVPIEQSLPIPEDTTAPPTMKFRKDLVLEEAMIQPAPLSAADATQISTREAELEVIRGATERMMAEAGIPEEKAAYRGRKFKLHAHQQECLIGRDLSCDLVLFDPDPTINRKISRQHARIEYRPEEGMFRLYNRGGNGTMIRRLRSPVMDDAVLNDRDVITIGRTAIQIRILGMEGLAMGGRKSRAARIVAVLAFLLIFCGALAAAFSFWIAPRLMGGAKPKAAMLWPAEFDGRAANQVNVAAGHFLDENSLGVVVGAGDGSVRMLDGTRGTEVWGDPPEMDGSDVRVQVLPDIDGDLFSDVVATSASPGSYRGSVAVISGKTGLEIWQEQPGCEEGRCSYAGPAALVDVNGDRRPEILVGGAGRNGGFLCLVDASNGVELWRYPDEGEDFGDVRHASLVVADDSGRTLAVGVGAGGELVSLDINSGALVASSKLGAGALSAPAAGDLNGDGIPKIVVLTEAYELLVVDPFTGGAPTARFSMVMDPIIGPAEEVLDRGEATAPIVMDLDGDGRDDVLMAHPGWDGPGDVNAIYTLRGPDLGKLRADRRLGDDHIVLAPPAAADFNWDGVPDAVFLVTDVAQREVSLLVLDGADGRELLRSPVDGGRAASAAPLLADLDGNGILDLVLGLEDMGVLSLDLGVKARDGSPWPGARGDLSNTGRGSARISELDRILRLGGAGLGLLGLLLLVVAFIIRRRARWSLG